MRLNSYLNEKADIDDIYLSILTIYNNCQPFLKRLLKGKYSGELLYSGRKGVHKDMFIGKVRNNRQPLDTPNKIHKIVDDLFYKEFGIRYRSNAIFCTGDHIDSNRYGLSYIIFPKGKFNFVWSPIVTDLYASIIKPHPIMDIIDYTTDDIKHYWYDDFINAFDNKREELFDKYDEYNDFDDYMNDDDIYNIIYTKYENEIALKVRDDLLQGEIRRIQDEISEYFNTDIKGAINSKHEIMVNTKEYIALETYKYMLPVIQYLMKYGNKKPTKEMINNMNIL